MFTITSILAFLLISSSFAISELPAELGFDVSTGLQLNPLTPSQIGAITSSDILSNVRYYKFFGWESDHDIAAGILASSSSPQDISFYIGMPAGTWITTLSEDDLETLVTEWDDLKDNVYCIALVNEPAIHWVDFSILPGKLNMTYSFLQSKPGWENVFVSIPFSQTIFDVTWPVPLSTFKAEHVPYIADVIDIYEDYGAPFSINLYPFYVAPWEPTLMGYILGEEALEYSSMLVAQYMATWFAMESIAPNNSLEIVITETGWSTNSSDYDFATLENAEIYYNNTFRQMMDPLNELYGVKIYAFELFDEQDKPGANWEKHWGVFNEQGRPKWSIVPTVEPTKEPTVEPTTQPTAAPSVPTLDPTMEPTATPLAPTSAPSMAPSAETANKSASYSVYMMSFIVIIFLMIRS